MEIDQLSLLVENMLELRSNIWELNSRLPGDAEVHPSKQQVQQDTPSNFKLKTFDDICFYTKPNDIKKRLFELLKRADGVSLNLIQNSGSNSGIGWEDLIEKLETEESGLWDEFWSDSTIEPSSDRPEQPLPFIRWVTKGHFSEVVLSSRNFIFGEDGKIVLGAPMDDIDDECLDEFKVTCPWDQSTDELEFNSVIHGRVWDFDFTDVPLMPLGTLQLLTVFTEALSFDVETLGFSPNVGVSFTESWSKRKRKAIVTVDHRSFSDEDRRNTEEDISLQKPEKRLGQREATDKGKGKETRDVGDNEPQKDKAASYEGMKKKKATEKDEFQARVFAAFHFRCLDQKKPQEPKRNETNYFQRDREHWEFEFPFDLNCAYQLREVRATVALSMQCDSNQNQPFYNICVLIDDTDTFKEPRSDTVYLSQYPMRGRIAGIGHFQTIVSSLLNDWATQWMKIIHSIGVGPEVEMKDAFDKKQVKASMFDENFDQIARYVSAIQILRILRSWIVETSNDIDQLCRADQWSWYSDDKKHIFSASDRETLTKGFKLLADKKQLTVNQVLALLQQKMDQIQSLRDGASDATALQEARHSATMNAYLFIFTVMTIFYLPLGFVSSLFGMHLFDNTEVSGTQRNFYITMVLASILTYVVAALAVWTMVPMERRDQYVEYLNAAFKWICSNPKARTSSEGGRETHGPSDAHQWTKRGMYCWLRERFLSGKSQSSSDQA